MKNETVTITRAEYAQLLEDRDSLNSLKSEETNVDTLSKRELQVFRLLGTGSRTRDIAESLGLSFKTIETYRENIKHKLSLVDATALIRRAIEWTQGQPV
jgi:DNA-binding NarL/FixJ family response regulator